MIRSWTRTLILGGARSGKEVIYIATAQAGGNEMALRIARHRQQRPVIWRTVEEPYALGDMLAQWSDRPGLIVLRSIGKFFGLAGVRLRFVAVHHVLLMARGIRLGLPPDEAGWQQKNSTCAAS